MLRLAARSSRQFINQFRKYSAENVHEFKLRSSDGTRISSVDFLKQVKDQTSESKDIALEEFQPPRAAFDALSVEYDTLREENGDLFDKYKRALAETENVRRRGQKQVDDTKVFAIQSFCKDLLEVSDVLNLALEAVKKEDLNKNIELKSLYDGISMTFNVLQKTFNRHGLQLVSPQGEKFDPNLHDAVFQAKVEPGYIDQVMKIGYSLHGRPIRAAQVGVVQG